MTTTGAIRKRAILALLLGAAAITPAISADPINLRMTALGNAGQGVQGVIAVWNKAHPEIHVSVEMQADETNWQATAPTTMFTSADGPDLSWWWCSPAFQYKDMIGAGLLAPLDDLYKSGAYPAGTVTYFTEPDGHKYGVNTDVVWTPYIYYNKDIFAKVGITPPKTWDELYADSAKIRAAGYQTMVTLYDYGMVNHLVDALMMRSWTQNEYNALLANWSPKASADSLKYKWTDPDGVRIFQTLKDIVAKGFAADGFAGLTDPEVAKSLFTSGKAAMFQDGSWDSNGDLAKAAKFPLDFFYYPPIQEKAYGPVGSWVPNCFIAFAKKPNVDAAKQVIAFLASTDGAVAYAKASGLTVGRTDIPSDTLKSMLNPMTAQMAEDVAKQGAPALFESSVPPDVLTALKQAAGDVLTGGATPEQAAQRMQDAYDKARKG